MNCYNCNNPISLLHKNIKTGDILYCSKCGLYTAKNIEFCLNGNDTELEEKLVSSFESLRKKNYSIIISKIKMHLKDKEKIVGFEVGCATGWFLNMATQEGFHMEAIEPEERFFSKSIDEGFYVSQGLFPQDVQGEKKYDFIIFNDVFEHLPELDTALEKISNMLTQDGLLIINCPTSDGIFFKIGKLFSRSGITRFTERLWQFDFYTPHYWYFNKSNLSELLKKSKFTLLEHFDLEVLHRENLKERIITGNNKTFINSLIYLGVKISLPVLSLLPKDTMCCFYRKD